MGLRYLCIFIFTQPVLLLEAQQMIQLCTLPRRTAVVQKQVSLLAPSTIKHTIERGDTDRLEFLLALGADPNMIIDEVETPLSVAITYFKVDALELLLKHGANPYMVIPALLETKKNAFDFAKDMRAIVQNTNPHQLFSAHYVYQALVDFELFLFEKQEWLLHATAQERLKKLEASQQNDCVIQ